MLCLSVFFPFLFVLFFLFLWHHISFSLFGHGLKILKKIATKINLTILLILMKLLIFLHLMHIFFYCGEKYIIHLQKQFIKNKTCHTFFYVMLIR